MTFPRFLAVLALLCPAAFAAEGPTYAPVKAQTVVARDGLPHVLKKLADGKDVHVAYLGGSITAANGWRPKSLKWFQTEFPGAKVSEINAAIGGTGSDLGVFRLGHDVLVHKPDLLFVEFAVNDGGAEPIHIWRAMEGIVRQTWAMYPDCDICFVYTFRDGYEKDLEAGNNPRAASAIEMLADHYGIPSINFAMKIAELRRADKLTIKGDKPEPGKILFSTDGVHPLDAPHQIYADLVTGGVREMRKHITPVDHAAKLSKPFVADHWQAAKMIPLTRAMLTGNWEELPDTDAKSKSFRGRLGPIWHTATPGAQLKLKLRGSQVKLYDLVGPDGGQVDVVIDGKQVNTKPIARFDHYCTYHRIATLTVAAYLDASTPHEITITLRPDQPDRTPASSREKDPKKVDPHKYEGTNLWVGAVLLIGDLTP